MEFHARENRKSRCRMQPKFFISVFSLFIAIVAPLSLAHSEDEFLNYNPAQLKPGTISSVGSDSMADLVRFWVDAYKEVQPSVTVNVVSRGSATAPAALIDGSADLGPMARPMKTNERDAFITRYGFEPTQIKTAYSAISVYVSKDNPLNEITLADLDRLYSAERRRGATTSATKWSDLNVSGPLANQSIVVTSPTKESVPAAYFRQQVLMQGEFAKSVLPTTSIKSLLQSVAANNATIGFGESVLNSEALAQVKVLAVKDADANNAILPSAATIEDGSYPISRVLSVYLVRFPGETIDPALKDFLNFVLSKQGQAVVAKIGLLPLSPTAASEELAKLN